MAHPLESKDWQVAYRWVEEEARAILDKLDAGSVLSTNELALRIIPPGPTEPGWGKRVYKALAAAATKTMPRYVTFGEVEQIGPRKGRRKTWHRPGAEIIPPSRPTCPGCGRPF